MAAVRGAMFARAGVSGIIVCAREFMNSLDDSSLAEVKEVIDNNEWLSSCYDVTEKTIKTKKMFPGHVEFKFAGLRRSLNSLRSKSKILILWVDEAEPVTEHGWNTVRPTVRDMRSEIWVTWNPRKKGSPTDKRFRQDPPKSSKIIRLNWNDNPWFNKTSLPEEMEEDKRRDMALYDYIWQGHYETRSDAAVFHKYKIDYFNTPEDARFFHGADWGFSVDPTVLVRCWIGKDQRTLYVDKEVSAIGCDIVDTPALFEKIETSRTWPITADSARPETISHLRRCGFNIKNATKGKDSVEEGVTFLKGYNIVIHPTCKRAIDEIQNYSYKIDDDTNEVLPQLIDKNNHVIDALRYALEDYRKAMKAKPPMKSRPHEEEPFGPRVIQV